MAISPDGQTLATGSYGEVTLWDAKSGTVRHRLGGFAHQVVALAFAPDGKTLVTGGGVPSESGEVKIVDVAGGKIIRDLPTPHTDVVYGVAVRPDGSLIATASADKTAKLFDMKTGARTGNFEGHTQHVLDVVWLPDGARFATGGADGLVKIWDVAKGEKIRDIPGFGKQVMRMAVHQKNAMVAAGDGSVKSINLETGGVNRTFAVGSNPVTAVSVTATGEQILAGCDDGMVKRFDVKTGKLIREWK
jgi:WD40 repeat protein